MSIQNLCEDIVTHIIYLATDLRPIRLTYKRWAKITKTCGFIRTLTFGINTPFATFINLNTKNLLSLNNLTMDCITDAPAWIPCKWPKQTIFNNCTMGNQLVDPPHSPTEILRIKDYTSSGTLNINWKKLSHLRELYIDISDCNLQGLIKYCPNLESIDINLRSQRDTTLPHELGKLTRLHTLITNIITTTTHHFISPHLRICLVPKTTPFTAISKHLPPSHLQINIYISMNINMNNMASVE